MDVSDVIAEWGALYRPQGQNVRDLIVTLRQNSITESLFPKRISQATIMEKTVAEFQRVLQRFQKDFTPIGNVVFSPTKISLYRLKIDVAETPDDLKDSWLGFLSEFKLDRKQWPFVKWWLNNLLIQAADDMEKYEVFNGVPGSITPGTATAAGTNLLGIRKQLNDGITAGTIQEIVMGTPPTDKVQFVQYVEAFWKQIPELVRNEIDTIVMSRDWLKLYKEGMRALYNAHYEQATSLVTLMDEEVTVTGVPSHAGSDKIWCTPKWNRQGGVKDANNETVFALESVDRKVKAFTDYYKGVGFWVPQYVFTNDVDKS